MCDPCEKVVQHPLCLAATEGVHIYNPFKGVATQMLKNTILEINSFQWLMLQTVTGLVALAKVNMFFRGLEVTSLESKHHLNL